MNRRRPITIAFVVMLAWFAVGAVGISRTAPTRDATFLVPGEELLRTSYDGQRSSIVLKANAIGYDRARVTSEVDGHRVATTWTDNALVVETDTLAPGLHHLASGIEHRGHVRRFVSTGFMSGASAPVARLYRRAVRVTLPTSLFDDHLLETDTDLVGAVRGSIERRLNSGASDVGLGRVERLELRLDLGVVDNALTVVGAVEFPQGSVGLTTDLELIVRDDRTLQIRRGRTNVEIDERLRSWASSNGSLLGGAAAAALGAGLPGILFAMAFGAEHGAEEADRRARDEVGATIDEALRAINGGLRIPEYLELPGLPEGVSLRPSVSDEPLVSDFDGVAVLLDITVEGPISVVGPVFEDPDELTAHAFVSFDDNAHVMISSALLAGLMPLVANAASVSASLGRSFEGTAHTPLAVDVRGIRALSAVQPSGIPAPGLPWALPAVAFELGGAATPAVAFVSGGLDISAAPDGSAIRVRPMPTFVRVGCRSSVEDGWELRPCLDTINAIAPDLPTRLAQNVHGQDVMSDMLQGLRAIPLDGSGRLILATRLANALATGGGAYGVKLDFDVRIAPPERATRSTGRAGRRRGRR